MNNLPTLKNNSEGQIEYTVNIVNDSEWVTLQQRLAKTDTPFQWIRVFEIVCQFPAGSVKIYK